MAYYERNISCNKNAMMQDHFQVAHTGCSPTTLVALSATYRKTYIQNMYILISYIQVKSLLADTLFTCIYEYTIYEYCTKCVS